MATYIDKVFRCKVEADSLDEAYKKMLKNLPKGAKLNIEQCENEINIYRFVRSTFFSFKVKEPEWIKIGEFDIGQVSVGNRIFIIEKKTHCVVFDGNMDDVQTSINRDGIDFIRRCCKFSRYAATAVMAPSVAIFCED